LLQIKVAFEIKGQLQKRELAPGSRVSSRMRSHLQVKEIAPG